MSQLILNRVIQVGREITDYCRNYRISILAALSKIHERNKGVQMDSHINGILSPYYSASGKDTAPGMPYFVQPKVGRVDLILMALLILF